MSELDALNEALLGDQPQAETEPAVDVQINAPVHDPIIAQPVENSMASAEPKPHVPDVTTSKATTDPEKATDPEYDKANWPVIFIEQEDQKPNYEFISVHGTLANGTPFGHELQIMRGVNVAVPPSVVHMLREAISAHYVPSLDSEGHLQLLRQDRSSVPWRLIKGGKYIE